MKLLQVPTKTTIRIRFMDCRAVNRLVCARNLWNKIREFGFGLQHSYFFIFLHCAGSEGSLLVVPCNDDVDVDGGVDDHGVREHIKEEVPVT